MSRSRSAAIGALLTDWYRRQARDLPWRRTSDPYRIWVSEIMLQQTRVEAVIPYYGRFLERFANVAALAEASESEVLERWAGLGYYRRARQLHAAAKQVVERHGGSVPADYTSIRALPGIGDYTAAAVASIAFDLPCAALDGNVMRVLTRLAADRRDIARLSTRRALQAEAQRLLDALPPEDAGDFNQAMMELGATVCTPRSPRCLLCPLARSCRARAEGIQEELPVKSRREKLEKLEMAVALVRRGSSLLMRRRPEDEAVMPGFWELPVAQGPRLEAEPFARLGVRLARPLGAFRHGITFRSYRGKVWEAVLEGKRPDEYRWIAAARRAGLPVTTISAKALRAAGCESVPRNS